MKIVTNISLQGSAFHFNDSAAQVIVKVCGKESFKCHGRFETRETTAIKWIKHLY